MISIKAALLLGVVRSTPCAASMRRILPRRLQKNKKTVDSEHELC